MTMTLRVKNEAGPYTAKLKRMQIQGDGFLPHSETPIGELAPGEETTVHVWKEAYLVVEEKKE